MTVIFSTPASKHISEVEYFISKKVLRITFRRDNHKYDYFDVPIDVVNQFQAASSKSKYFTKYIKFNYKVSRVNISQ